MIASAATKRRISACTMRMRFTERSACTCMRGAPDNRAPQSSAAGMTASGLPRASSAMAIESNPMLVNAPGVR